MQSWISAVLGALVGIVATVLVGRHYYRRSVNKKLSVYLQFAAPVLASIEPVLRQELKVFLRDQPIEDLTQLQFFVVNEGERPIRDLIRPLTLELPKGLSSLDAGVLYESPLQRRCTVLSEQPEGEPWRLVFDIPLLNAGEFILVKVLCSGDIGDVRPRDFIFTITGDDLPPRLTMQHLPLHGIKHRFTARWIWTSIGIGTASTLIGLAWLRILYFLFSSTTSFQILDGVALGLGAIGILVALIVGWHWIVNNGVADLFRKPIIDLPDTVDSWHWGVLKSLDSEVRYQRFLRKDASPGTVGAPPPKALQPAAHTETERRG